MALPARATALQLSGILLYAADAEGNRVGQAWHTTSGAGGRPLSFDAWNPGTARTMPLPNDSHGEIEARLLYGTHVLTLFFQPDEDAFPPILVLDLFFDGDKDNPKISALVLHQRGFTHTSLNPAIATLSLYLQDVENSANLVFDDGELQARLGAAFYFPSSGIRTHQWLVGDLFNIDRVGRDELLPDGRWDGIFVLELDVTVSPQRAPVRQPAPPAPAPPRPAFVPPEWVEQNTPRVLMTPTVELEFPTPLTTSTPGRWESPVPATPGESTPATEESPGPDEAETETPGSVTPEALPSLATPGPATETPGGRTPTAVASPSNALPETRTPRRRTPTAEVTP